MIKKIFGFLGILMILSSCASREKIAYFQNVSSIENSSNFKYEPVLKPDDLLLILVSAADPEAAAPFNLPAIGVMGATTPTDYANMQARYQTYLIDNEGMVRLPLVGTIKLGGLSRSEALSTLNMELKKYINDPIINLRIINYKISVIGEVVRPGSFTVQTERITLPEAISMSGDMTIYGSRKNVLVIREIDDKKTYNFVDMTKADFVNSPFYYLSQNDLVYVEPNKTRINSSVIGPNITVGLSGLSLLITIIALATR